MTATLKMLGRALLAVTVVAAFAALAPAVAGASVAKTALINADSVTTGDGITNSKGEAISLEQFAAENAGFTVTVASGAEWEAMSAEQFAQYQVLIVGDPFCDTTPESANTSASNWAPVVMSSGGNRVVVGTDPEYHYSEGEAGASPTNPEDPTTAGAEHLVQDGITFAGGVTGATGIYFDTSCHPGTTQATLEKLTTAGAGSWSINEHIECFSEVRQIASVPGFDSGPTKLTDADIDGWECSAHMAFPSYPADWQPLAVATDVPSTPTCGTDPESGEPTCGQAYVLVSGVGIVATSPNISLSPATHSDPEGGTHAVTATVVEQEQVELTAKHHAMAPAPGKQVTFAVSGINNGAKGTCTYPDGTADPECLTDSNGQVVFTYADTHGAGSDTINASVVIGESVQHATASETWTAIEKPVTVTPPTTTTVVTPPAVASTGVLAFGAARLASSPPACVASSGYLASVAGKGIASVTFSVDGHKVATVRHANHHGAFAARIKVHSAGRHHLAMHVVFTSAANTKPLTIRRTIARCAARPVITPRFTG